MHCNLRPPYAAPVLVRFNSYARAKFHVDKPIRCRIIIIAFLLLIYVTLRCKLDLWPSDLDLWPLTLNICSIAAVPWLNSVPNLSAIEQSAAELLRFQYDLMTLNMYHVLRSGQCWQRLNSVNLSVPDIAFLLLICCHAVTLTFDPLTLNSLLDPMSCDQIMCQIWARSINPRLSYWRFSNFFQGEGAEFQTLLLRRGDQTTKLEWTEFHYRCTK